MTARALGLDVDAISLPGGAGVLDSIEPLILLFFAWLAALGRVCQAFRSVERLLTRSPYELLAAVDAENIGIL